MMTGDFAPGPDRPLQSLPPLRPRRQLPAFTLVELLVVMAVIGILIGLAMPAFIKARDLARRTACANNLRQIFIALENYGTRWDTYPPDRNTNIISRTSGRVGLGYLVPDDVGDMGVYFCPAASEITRSKYGVPDDKVGTVNARCSYLYEPSGVPGVVCDYNGSDNVNHKGRTVNLVRSDGSIAQLQGDGTAASGIRSQ